jgi:type III restriction enzyme
MQLKTYQNTVLEILSKYLRYAKETDPEIAFQRIHKEFPEKHFKPSYKSIKEVKNVPYVCMRIPTGGGKTILAGYAIKAAIENYIQRDYPVVLWLVPTNTIREQTKKHFMDAESPYYKALADEFDGKFAIYDITDVNRIRSVDLETKVCIIIGTFASLRIGNTDGRKFYSSNENLEPIFARLNLQTEGLEKEIEGERSGQIKLSFANILKILEPLVIIDEAHNARTKLTYDVFERIKPACILEFTATPNYSESNVLCRISAQELKQENMIKLPIILTGHPSWQESIHHAVGERNKLEQYASSETEYIRPILLIQAEHKNKEVTVDVVKKFLIEQESLEENTIAIETGDIKNLENVNLFDSTCKIRTIITVEALKEGWDCSFAYVFCSVANIHSSKNVEQLLGRVLRMPYADRRRIENLNKAYAHVSSPNFIQAASEVEAVLKDMGFEKEEINDAIVEQTLFQDDSDKPLFNKVVPLKLEIENTFDFKKLPEEAKTILEITKLENGNTIITSKDVISEDLKNAIVSQIPEEKRNSIQDKIERFNFETKIKQTPAQKGIILSLPQLCVYVQGELELLEKETVLSLRPWDLALEESILTKEEFNDDYDLKSVKIDIFNNKLIHSIQNEDGNQFELDLKYNEGISDLTQWLDRTIRHNDINQEKMIGYCSAVTRYLLNVRKIELTKLILLKFILAKSLKDKIERLRANGMKKSYQDVLFHTYQTEVIVSYDFNFQFDTRYYPLTRQYNRGYQFTKHYYGNKIQEFDSDEEFECAKTIDSINLIETWVRNIPRQPNMFSLPTSSDKFYPDFVCKLTDGRMAVIEYKGADRFDNPEEVEKKIVGEAWAKRSEGKCLFLCVSKKISKDLYTQILNNLSLETTH